MVGRVVADCWYAAHRSKVEALDDAAVDMLASLLTALQVS